MRSGDGIADQADAVIIDTAGRLHTKVGLMDELGKVKRAVEKQAPVDEVLLVLDATTGQNGLTQARVFSDVVDITGIVLTKMMVPPRAGSWSRVQRELGVPVKLVAWVKARRLAPFEPRSSSTRPAGLSTGPCRAVTQRQHNAVKRHRCET